MRLSSHRPILMKHRPYRTHLQETCLRRGSLLYWPYSCSHCWCTVRAAFAADVLTGIRSVARADPVSYVIATFSGERFSPDRPARNKRQGAMEMEPNNSF